MLVIDTLWQTLFPKLVQFTTILLILGTMNNIFQRIECFFQWYMCNLQIHASNGMPNKLPGKHILPFEFCTPRWRAYIY